MLLCKRLERFDARDGPGHVEQLRFVSSCPSEEPDADFAGDEGKIVAKLFGSIIVGNDQEHLRPAAIEQMRNCDGKEGSGDPATMGHVRPFYRDHEIGKRGRLNNARQGGLNGCVGRNHGIRTD